MPERHKELLVDVNREAISLKFRLLSIRFTSEAFVSNRKMSEIDVNASYTRSGCQYPVSCGVKGYVVQTSFNTLAKLLPTIFSTARAVRPRFSN